MHRIDGRAPLPRPEPRVTRTRTSAPAAAWRPPGLAWAASFLLLVGVAALAGTAYRWSQPLYATYTEATSASPRVLHIAFLPSMSIAEVDDVLRSAGANVVAGPDSTGIFGVTPVARSADGARDAADLGRQLHALAARLRADARVRWVEPLSGDAPTGAPQP
jgi:hypothetical protein